MNSASPPSPIRDSDYDALETALAQTMRGRWFLAEYVRRHQPAEFAMLRDALQKLERVVASPSATPTRDVLRRDLIEMSEAVGRTQREIAALAPPGPAGGWAANAAAGLDAMVPAAKSANAAILRAAEDIQEVAWQLREKGIDEGAGNRLEKQAREIYSGCAAQDVNAKRMEKIVEVLRFLESRVSEMIKIWGLEPIDTDIEMPEAHGVHVDLLDDPRPVGQDPQTSSVDLMVEVEAIDRDIDDIG